ncbi:ABC-type branched-chain amino acid transport system, ATPase component [Geosmithia morbida]|uniref:ABC-type branched-chain amino acid transport system, ATPase component n=1 Tax=Geosmithia morbida TaxID=1094350 RepID=A0A9P4YRG7_9HYPO|nr:ABC-type branched-chain amino acid transport system, ATPase component [Geosmithia morbida]KAF4121761.1 ABC-type branched-chain amino acid transport system, ATPase component [Geosmithia morbida]
MGIYHCFFGDSPGQLELLRDRHVESAVGAHRQSSIRLPPLPLLFPSFNCLLPAHTCAQYAGCNEFNGKCDCPEGFGGDDCLQPLCGSLARGKDRSMRSGPNCHCDDGWTGINCNVCTENKACNALMETGEGGVCYQNGEVINHNYQICDVTNKKITGLLGKQRPEVTFTCEADDATCDFQFWVDAVESFYCHLSDCTSDAEFSEKSNKTSYQCDHISCSCIPDHQSIKGPGSFECAQKGQGSHECAFKEPEMDSLILALIGDSSIFLGCHAGECIYETEVPGYKRPVKKINTPLIAGVIAGCALFVGAVIILIWFLSRRKLKYGAIRLDDSDDESTKLMVDHKPVSLQFKNVSYSLNGKSILQDIQGICKPGEVTAIMGASGAGKTTFLDILARKNKRGQIGGEFYVNGEKVSDPIYRNVVGFVDQEDTMLPTLTVHETILNSALLRLPKNMGHTAKEMRVSEVEKELGIHHIRDSLIGSEEGKGRGISGGEKRRVGIACELVTSPAILFLDEPTSGLDAFNAFNVVECLVTLAKTYKRTVIFTIHQPRSNIVALFDRLILLARGKTVFSGPFAHCQEYFDGLGYECPPGFNIADYLVDLTMHAGNTFSVDDGTIPADSVSVGPSSTTAVKSIASVSGLSTGDDSVAETASTLRPKASKNDSIKQRQDRELFTRRRSADTAATSEVGAEDVGSYRLQHNPSSSLSSQLLEDVHGLPPSATIETDLDIVTRAFSQSDIAASTSQEIQQAILAAENANGANANGGDGSEQSFSANAIGKGYARVGYLRQFVILSGRTWKNLYRNPVLMLTHYATAIILAVFSGYLFYGLTDDIPGFQNRLGLFIFLLTLFGFSTLTSLNVFATERLLFVRERANGYYVPATYFAAKMLFDIIPLRIIPPILMGSIVYPMTGLVPDAEHFFKFMLVLVLFNMAAATICLFIGIVCKDGGVANLIGSLVMLFSLLFAGFLLNHDAIPQGALWLQTLSIFHYGFESLIVNEVLQLTLVDKKYGLDITVPGAAILSSFGFDNNALWDDIRNLGIVAIVFVVLAYGAMHILLVERR